MQKTLERCPPEASIKPLSPESDLLDRTFEHKECAQICLIPPQPSDRTPCSQEQLLRSPQRRRCTCQTRPHVSDLRWIDVHRGHPVASGCQGHSGATGGCDAEHTPTRRKGGSLDARVLMHPAKQQRRRSRSAVQPATLPRSDSWLRRRHPLFLAVPQRTRPKPGRPDYSPPFHLGRRCGRVPKLIRRRSSSEASPSA